jgi:deazaflavin-dependent oxidoreductase (nitroreductase family)
MDIGAPVRKPTGLRRALLRAPILLYRLGLGRLLGGGFVLINHTGRRTGRPRQTVVEVVDRSAGSLTVVAGFGPRSDWYRNLLARPAASIVLAGRAAAVTATPLPAEQAAQAMLRYARRHPRAARRLAGVMGYRVDGTDSDYLEMGRRLRMLSLDFTSAER